MFGMPEVRTWEPPVPQYSICHRHTPTTALHDLALVVRLTISRHGTVDTYLHRCYT